MAKIKVLIKRPDEKIGHVCCISSSLENLQRTVEGYIEVCDIGGGAVMLLNEDAKLKGLEPNFLFGIDMIAGTVIVCGREGEEFTDIPISRKLWASILKRWGNFID